MSKSYSIVASNHIPGAEDFVKNLPAGAAVVLVREPINQHDRNAVAVWVDGRKVGYVPKRQNAALALFIDQAGREWAGPQVPGAEMVMDEAETAGARAIDARFARSPNSNYPMVEVD